MMICKADFQELFPDIFGVDPIDGLQPKPDAIAEDNLARLENDAGPFGVDVWANLNPAVARQALAPNLMAFGAFWAPFAGIGFGWQGEHAEALAQGLLRRG